MANIKCKYKIISQPIVCATTALNIATSQGLTINHDDVTRAYHKS